MGEIIDLKEWKRKPRVVNLTPDEIPLEEAVMANSFIEDELGTKINLGNIQYVAIDAENLDVVIWFRYNPLDSLGRMLPIAHDMSLHYETYEELMASFSYIEQMVHYTRRK